MANITASTAFREYIAGRLSNVSGAGPSYYFCTLHIAAGGAGTNGGTGSAIVASSIYSPTTQGELSTNASVTGYTLGGKSLGNVAESGGVLSASPVVWTAGSGNCVADIAAIWVNTSNTITGASLVCLANSSQTATPGSTMTATIGNFVTIPTSA